MFGFYTGGRTCSTICLIWLDGQILQIIIFFYFNQSQSLLASPQPHLQRPSSRALFDFELHLQNEIFSSQKWYLLVKRSLCAWRPSKDTLELWLSRRHLQDVLPTLSHALTFNGCTIYLGYIQQSRMDRYLDIDTPILPCRYWNRYLG